jgi:hypothetical protein
MVPGPVIVRPIAFSYSFPETDPDSSDVCVYSFAERLQSLMLIGKV